MKNETTTTQRKDVKNETGKDSISQEKNITPKENIAKMTNEIKVSFFQNAQTAGPKEVKVLSDIFSEIKTGFYSAFTERTQVIYNKEGKSERYKAFKAEVIPAFTPGGTFSKRNSKSLIQHSGIIHADIDDMTGDIQKIRKEIESDPHCFFCFVSPSGNGLKAGYLFDGAAEIKTNAHHKAYYNDLRKRFEGKYKIPADKSCSDVSRLCFVSHDPGLYYNPDAVPFPRVAEPKAKKKPKKWSNPQNSLILSDADLLEIMFAADNGDKIRALYGGDMSAQGDDHSAADQALCNHLAFYTCGDAGRIDTIFRSSGLYRDKWEREDYRERTINNAISSQTNFYSPKSSLANNVIEEEWDFDDMGIAGENAGGRASEYIDPKKFASEYYDKNKKLPGNDGLFSLQGQMYLSMIKEKDGEFTVIAYEVSDFIIQTLYREYIEKNDKGHSEWTIRARVTPKNENPIDIDICSRDLSSSGSITRTLADRANVSWIPYNDKASRILQKKLRRSKTPIIQRLMTTGRTPDGYFVLPDFCITPDGKKELPDKNGLFSKYRPCPIDDTISPDFKNGVSAADFQKMIYAAWGDKALVFFSWVVSSWFRAEILPRTTFFPFISLYGPPQMGKSGLLSHMQYIQGFRAEGITANQQDTAKGIARQLAQRSGLFNAILEKSDKSGTKLDFGFLLTGFNGNNIQTRAKTSNDNQTVSSPLLSGIAFVANQEPFTTPQEKERFISLCFRKDDLTPETYQAYNDLCSIPPEGFPNIFAEIMSHRQMIKREWLHSYMGYRKELNAYLNDNRVSEVHAIPLAFHKLICSITGNQYNIDDYIRQIAREKIANKHTVYFLADTLLEYLFVNAENEPHYNFVRVYKDKGEIAFNLAEAFQTDYGRTLDKTKTGEQLQKHPARFTPKSQSVSFNNKKKKCYWFKLDMLSFHVDEAEGGAPDIVYVHTRAKTGFDTSGCYECKAFSNDIQICAISNQLISSMSACPF